MAILLVIPPFSNTNDAKNRVDSILRWLKVIDDVDILTANFPFKIDGINVINVEQGYKLYEFSKGSLLKHVFKHALLQIKFSIGLLRMIKDYDIVIFWFGGIFVLPLIASRLSSRKTILIVTGSWHETFGANSSNRLVYRILKGIEKVCYRIPTDIIILTPSMIDKVKVSKHKIICIPDRPIDTNIFKPSIPFKDRSYAIGYVGRLEEGKGIMELLEAMKMIDDIRLIIVGDGPLLDKVKKYIHENRLDNIILTGWVDKEKVADYLNNIRLLILPSSSEGLPSIILESMACATPVMAMNVGGIRDVIRDGFNGILLNSNSPKYLAYKITEALHSDTLYRLSLNAYRFVIENYTYESLLPRYKKIFRERLNIAKPVKDN